MKSKEGLGALGIVAVIALTIGIVTWTWSSHDSQVGAWAEANGYKVVKIERVHFHNDSPFWRRKGDDLVRVTLRDGEFHERTSFFRWGLFGMDQAWKE